MPSIHTSVQTPSTMLTTRTVCHGISTCSSGISAAEAKIHSAITGVTTCA